jgi:serine/threonine protein kinase
MLFFKIIFLQTLQRRTLAEIVGLEGTVSPTWLADKGCTRADLMQFLELVQSLLEFDPAIRMHPSAALHHPFFQQKRLAAMQASNTSSAMASLRATRKTSSTVEALQSAVVEEPGMDTMTIMSTPSSYSTHQQQPMFLVSMCVLSLLYSIRGGGGLCVYLIPFTYINRTLRHINW